MDRIRLQALCASLVTTLALAACGQADDQALPPPHLDVDASVVDTSVDTKTDTPVEADAAPQSCVPKDCEALDAECGTVPDGCGGKIACGTCATGVCGGAGANRCGADSCIPKTCFQLDASCGYASDGCSEAIDCGGCPAPQTCGGGGSANQCGCHPKTCVGIGASCGTAPDGCGGILSCGACHAGQTCGSDGPNRCGTGDCTPKTCVQLSASCGLVSDQCSKAIDCGECTDPDVCGGQGIENQCGCLWKTCSQLGASCGKVDAGCGFDIDCGACPAGVDCGAGGIPNQCGCSCTLPHAQAQCADGGCGVAACDLGWGDCDGDPANGCETDLTTDSSHCGGCGTPCDDGNACTVGDRCEAASCVPGAATTCASPPNTACYEATGSCDPATGGCSYSPKANDTPCGTTVCGNWGTCTWAGECSNSGTQSRSCTDYRCAGGACNPIARNESQACSRVIANGTSCSAGYCCSNSCVARNSKTNCGSCGVNCGTQSCVQITGLSQYSCTCASNAFCQGAGFGGISTCYTASGQSVCNCQCPSGTSCTGQCAGGGTCADVTGHNYCHY